MEVKAIACELPARSGVPLSRWSTEEVVREAVERGLVAEISGATVWRWLSKDAFRPFYHRSWIFPRNLAFQKRYEQADEPFAWKFTRHDLDRLLSRLAEHQPLLSSSAAAA